MGEFPNRATQIRPGQVLNPTGRNQYTARREFEAAIDQLLREKVEGDKTRAQAIAEMALSMAQAGDGRLLSEVLKRLWPANERRELSGPAGGPVPLTFHELARAAKQAETADQEG